MPKVYSCQTGSTIARHFIFAAVGGLLALVTLSCNQEKQEDLNPPPPEPAHIDTTPRTVVKPEPPPAAAPTTAPTTGTAPVTQPLGGGSIGETRVNTPTPTTTEPATAPAAISATTQAIGIPTTTAASEPSTTPATSEPSTAPTAEPATKPESAPSQTLPGARSFTGVLHGGIVAVGSETSGWALHVDGATGALDVDVTAISGQVKSLDGRHVTITGRLKEKNWPALSPPNGAERGMTRLLIAESIAVAPLPDMNK